MSFSQTPVYLLKNIVAASIAAVRSKYNDGVRHAGLEAERGAKGPQRKNAPRSNSRAGVDDDEAEILLERGILEAVIHDDGIEPQRFEEAGAKRPVAADNRGGGLCQKQRFIARARGIVQDGINEMRAAFIPAKAAR